MATWVSTPVPIGIDPPLAWIRLLSDCLVIMPWRVALPLLPGGPVINIPHELLPLWAHFETTVWKLLLVVSGLIHASTLIAVDCWRLAPLPKFAKWVVPFRSKAWPTSPVAKAPL